MPYFRIGDHHNPGQTIVQAPCATDAVAWFFSQISDLSPNRPVSIDIALIDIVDLMPDRTVPTRSTKSTTSTNVQHTTTTAAKDELTHQEAMRITGLKSQAVSDYKWRGVFALGKTKGNVTRASVEAWLANQKHIRPRSTPSTKATKQSTPPAFPAEEMVREEKLAKELRITEEQVRSIKKRHNITGGFGWVDRIAFIPAFEQSQNDN